jgi:hypothetical protein
MYSSFSSCMLFFVLPSFQNLILRSEPFHQRITQMMVMDLTNSFHMVACIGLLFDEHTPFNSSCDNGRAWRVRGLEPRRKCINQFLMFNKCETVSLQVSLNRILTTSILFVSMFQMLRINVPLSRITTAKVAYFEIVNIFRLVER